MIGSTGLPQDPERIRDMLDAVLRPGSRSRRARVASSERSSPRETAPRRCARIKAPTLVIHGSKDPMVSPSGGKATAKAIPGARLMIDRGDGSRPPRGRVAAADPGDRRPRATPPIGRPAGASACRRLDRRLADTAARRLLGGDPSAHARRPGAAARPASSGCPSGSRYLRFQTPLTELRRRAAVVSDRVDHHDHEALVALDRTGATRSASPGSCA